MYRFIFILLITFSSNFTYSQIENDKALHFLGGNLYGLVGAGIANEISDGNRTWTFIGSVGGSLLVGLAKEAIDEKQYGGWDNSDLLATVLGGVTVGVTIDIFKKRKQRKRDKLFRDAVSLHTNQKIIKSLSEFERNNSLALLGMSSMVLNRN